MSRLLEAPLPTPRSVEKPWHLLAVALLAGGVQLTAQTKPGERAPDARPNVLLILADDLGFSDLGCYGGEIDTPNLDRLAKGGLRFSSFYNSARCCPSRASLLTGLHPHQAGIGSFTRRRPRAGRGPAYSGRLLPNCVSVASLMRDAGYSTWMVGKWHLGLPGPIDRGFEQYYGYRDLFAYAADQWQASKYQRLPAKGQPELPQGDAEFYATDAFNDYALEFLRQARSKNKPWFLYVAHSSPHFPVQAPKATIDKYVARYRRGWDELRTARLERMKQLGSVPQTTELPARSIVPVDRNDIANGYSGRANPAWADLPEDRREDLARRMATYAAMVEHVDRGVGRIVRDLEKHGELANTLILFTSDNGACYEWGPFGFDGPSRRGKTTLRRGDALAKTGQAGTHQSYGSAWAMLCNTPLNMYKHFCHEGGIASPLIAHWPRGLGTKSSWIHDATHIMDLAPTILDAASLRYPERYKGRMLTPVEGRSLLALCKGDALAERSLAFEHQGARALRLGRHKVVWSKRERGEIRWRLFDLALDRSEQRDLAPRNPALTKKLVAAWETWAKRVGAEPFFLPDQAVSPQTRGKRHPAHATPRIANREISIDCEVETQGHDGVIVAQGGRRFGYALHLAGGKLAFDVRIRGKVTRVLSKLAVPRKFRAQATLDARSIKLHVEGRLLARIESPGLIPEQPSDPLEVGRDTRSAAGDYAAPNDFAGVIHRIEVKAR